MHLVLCLVSIDKSLKKATTQNPTEFRSQSLLTQAKSGEGLIALILTVENGYCLMRKEIIEMSTNNI